MIQVIMLKAAMLFKIFDIELMLELKELDLASRFSIVLPNA
ncbi:hypothetical protein [Aurantibacter crassamenti]|nr:hypothetical protein [Aurantibacter crassamenti]